MPEFPILVIKNIWWAIQINDLLRLHHDLDPYKVSFQGIPSGLETFSPMHRQVAKWKEF